MEPRERAEPPIDPSDADADVVIRPHDSTRAAGVDAVTSTVAVTLRQAGWRSTLPLLAKLNQRDGFDCPSCAWPDPKHRSVAEFCENGAKAAADAASSARLTPEWLATQTIDELAARSDQWFNDAGRLTAPIVRRKGSDRYEPISWEDALAMAGKRLASLPDPNRAAFYTSGRASNEAAFLYQLFVRELGTNNLPDCSNMCHESSGVALAPTVGIGKGSVTLEDIEVADVVIVIGQNPGTNAPRMLTALQRVVEHGGSIVSVNPMRERGLVGVRNPQDFS
ncbi:MAG: molybdopterin-dependent oxidoreductase, partial [Acidimicrobiia bacterium]|nr:molybdopterin-dependent oxidoreductase [Acidimicrobiia bacterium]